MMKKLLYIDTKTVCINIFKVACFPMMVKNRRIITTYPEMEKYEMKIFLTVDPFLSVQLQHTHFELEVSGDHLVQVDHKTMG